MRIEERNSTGENFEATTTAAKTGKTIDLDTDGLLRGIWLLIKGTITIATTACTGYAGNGLKILNLLKNLAILGDGKEKYMENVDLAQLVRMMGARTGKSPVIGNITALTAAAYAVDLQVYIPFRPQNWRDACHPEAASYGLPAWKHDKLQLRYDERPLNEVLTPDTTTVLSEALVVSVAQDVQAEYEADLPVRCIRYFGDSLALASAGSGQKLDIRGDYLLRALFVDAFNNTVPSDDIVGDLKLQIKRGGAEINRFNRDWEALQGRQDVKSGTAHESGALLLMLDEGNGDGTELLSNASYAKLEPTITTAPTATAELKVIKEVIYV